MEPEPINRQLKNLVLRLEPIIAERARENEVLRKGNQPGSSCQNSDDLHQIDTKKELAKTSGLSHDTIQRADFIQKNIDEEIAGMSQIL